MSVSSTSKVSGSSSPLKRTERHYGVGTEGNPFVETIDTTNNVLIRDDAGENRQQQSAYEREDKEEKPNGISASQTYVSSGALEALSASGVYDIPETPINTQHHKVNVYDNNQAIIGDDNDNTVDNPYHLKHLYEKNEILEEIDELI